MSQSIFNFSVDLDPNKYGSIGPCSRTSLTGQGEAHSEKKDSENARPRNRTTPPPVAPLGLQSTSNLAYQFSDRGDKKALLCKDTAQVRTLWKLMSRIPIVKILRCLSCLRL